MRCAHAAESDSKKWRVNLEIAGISLESPLKSVLHMQNNFLGADVYVCGLNIIQDI